MEGGIPRNSGLGSLLAGLSRISNQDVQNPASDDPVNRLENMEYIPTAENKTFKSESEISDPERMMQEEREEEDSRYKESQHKTELESDITGCNEDKMDTGNSNPDHSQFQENKSWKNDDCDRKDDESTYMSNKEAVEDQRSGGASPKLSVIEKSLRGNMTYEEETELKKNTSIGAILSGLSTGSYGTKAKENVVRVQGGRKRNHFNDRWGYNKRFDYGWGNDSWNSWGQEQQFQEPEIEEDPHATEELIMAENKLLEEEFGKGVVSLMIDNDGGVVYVCEICHSQMNARKSLDVHIDGIKHLKRKNQWDKRGKFTLNPPETLLLKEKESESSKGDVEKKVPTVEKKVPTPIPTTGNEKGSSSTGAHGQGNYNNPAYNQLPSYMPPMGMLPGTGSAVTGLIGALPPSHVSMIPPYLTAQNGPSPVPKEQWGKYESTPPPPPSFTPQEKPEVKAPVEEKPKVKTNLSGGATGTLLQKLAACAVKNLKDSDLATNVVIALVKTMKEYNHMKADTKSIEVLTEIDIKLRGLKAQMPPVGLEAEKKSSSKILSGKENTSSPVASDSTQKPIHPYYSTGGRPLSTDDAGTWYSQTKGNNMVPPHLQGPPQTVGSGKSSASGYAAHTKGGHYSTEYPGYNTSSQNQMGSQGSGGYASKASSYSHGSTESQASYNYPGQAAPKAVIDIIQSSTAPPPPPPANAGGYDTHDYSSGGYQGGYASYYNTESSTGSQYGQQY